MSRAPQVVSPPPAKLDYSLTGVNAALAGRHPNFAFHLALSSPLAEDEWTGPVGFIHEVVLANYLGRHPDPKAIEYYLCGPPTMIRACTRMLADLGVPANHIAYDEF